MCVCSAISKSQRRCGSGRSCKIYFLLYNYTDTSIDIDTLLNLDNQEMGGGIQATLPSEKQYP